MNRHGSWWYLILISGSLLYAATSVHWRITTPPLRSRIIRASDRRLAPDLEFKGQNGEPILLSRFSGKTVLLNFWATWCKPCEVELPWLSALAQSFPKDRFALVGVAMDDDGWTKVQPYTDSHAITYEIVLGDKNVTDKLGGLSGLPTSLLIDADGKIAAVFRGAISQEVYQRSIIELMAQK